MKDKAYTAIPGPNGTTNFSLMDAPEGVKTLRDEFAMAAMSGFLANGYGGSSEELANAAYEVAFYMLKAREQK